MFSISSIDYNPVLRGKPGELMALDRLFPPIKERIGPTIVLPPISKRDHEKKRPLSATEAIHLHVGRIAESWKDYVFFLDTRFLKLSPSEEEDCRYLDELLALISMSKCRGIPVVGLRTARAKLAIFRKYIERTKSGALLRVSISEVDIPDLDERLGELLKELGCGFNEAVLQLDFGESAIVDVGGFSELIVNSFDRVHEIGAWNRISVAASNYPEQNPASENNFTTVQRREWTAWQKAATADRRIQRSMFADFGADNGKIVFLDSKGLPVPHLRYALADTWLVSRGGASSATVDGSIRGAALRITASKFFSGDTFSWGDQFISDCASNLSRPGTPTIWRAANMNRHMSRVITDLGPFVGHEVKIPVARYSPLQTALPL